MASLGHVAVGIAAARAYDGGTSGRRLVARMLACGLLALVPDADVIGFRFHVAYGSTFGHRGATHSLVAAIGVALLAGAVAWTQTQGGTTAKRRRSLRIFLCVLVVVGSHGPLDMLTDGGKGVALFWPVTDARLFFPWRPIPVAPIGARVLSPSGFHAMLFELVAFVPFWSFALWPRGIRPPAGRPRLP